MERGREGLQRLGLQGAVEAWEEGGEAASFLDHSGSHLHLSYGHQCCSLLGLGEDEGIEGKLCSGPYPMGQ